MKRMTREMNGLFSIKSNPRIIIFGLKMDEYYTLTLFGYFVVAIYRQ